MPAREKITKRMLEKHAPACRGIKTVLAKSMGVCYATLNNYLRRHPEMNKVIDDAREIAVGEVENVLYDLCMKKSFPAIAYLLNRIGRDRGFGERVEVNHTGEGYVDLVDALKKRDNKQE